MYLTENGCDEETSGLLYLWDLWRVLKLLHLGSFWHILQEVL
jgi:hypothetical protein